MWKGTARLGLMAAIGMGLAYTETAMAIEEPSFEVLEKSDAIELRRYKPFIVAETFVEGGMDEASNEGFRRIAGYIFGGNRSVRAAAGKAAEKIAMTAPVTVEAAPVSEKIAMTAPVAVEPQGGAEGAMKASRWRVHFVMPAEYTMATLPRPDNPAVLLREVPSRRYAAIVFSGLAGEERAQQKTGELLAWMQARNLRAVGTPQLARYNPPWTLPFWRRNEILVEVAET